MAATARHKLTLDPMGKCSNAFFSETTNMIKAKLYMNVHWIVLHKRYVFCSDIKFKMAATAGLSWTLDPMEKNVSKRFFSETTWTVETILPRNDHWKVLYKVSIFYAVGKSKMAAITGHSINTGPYEENTEIYSSLKLLHWLNLNHWKVLYKLCVFVLMVIPKWLPLQDIVFA